MITDYKLELTNSPYGLRKLKLEGNQLKKEPKIFQIYLANDKNHLTIKRNINAKVGPQWANIVTSVVC